MNKKLRLIAISVAATAFSTLAIQASDTLRGIENNLAGLAGTAHALCGEGTKLMQMGAYGICVDIYEASPGASCPKQSPENSIETSVNLAVDACMAQSKQNQMPWRFISFNQAQQACARAGKRLLTNGEWYHAVSGSVAIENCVTSGRTTPMQSGTSECVSPGGFHDMIGNVWEWVDAEVVNGEYSGRTLPSTGYVAVADGDGIVIETDEEPHDDYGADYASSDNDGVNGMVRGGFYASGDDAGMYALNAAVALNTQTAGIGFRCVKDVAF